MDGKWKLVKQLMGAFLHQDADAHENGDVGLGDDSVSKGACHRA